jgi:hypothetical protein
VAEEWEGKALFVSVERRKLGKQKTSKALHNKRGFESTGKTARPLRKK